MAFSEDTLKRAFVRSKGQCECWRKACGHQGRCSATFTYTQRATSDKDTGWQANHILSSGAGGGDGLENCEVLCVPCHKSTRSYGAH